MVMPEMSASWKASVPIDALATWPVSQPARVNGTHGAGVTVFGATVRAAVAGGTGA